MYTSFGFENVGTDAAIAFLLSLAAVGIFSFIRDRKKEKEPIGKVNLLEFPSGGVKVKKSKVEREKTPSNFHGRGAPYNSQQNSLPKTESDQSVS